MNWKGKIGEVVRQIGYIRLILLLICGFFLIAVSLPEKKEDSEASRIDGTSQNINYDTDENDLYIEKMEERLAGILQMMEGAGRVEVMITLASSSETVINKDRVYEDDSEKENGASGKENVKMVRKEETVFTEKEGNQSPYIIKTVVPSVEGIIVVMDGGNNPQVAGAVTEAVQALFHVEAHKIKVLKMEVGE